MMDARKLVPAVFGMCRKRSGLRSNEARKSPSSTCSGAWAGFLPNGIARSSLCDSTSRLQANKGHPEAKGFVFWGFVVLR